MAKRATLLDDSARLMRDFMSSAVFFQDVVARAAGLTASDLQTLGVLVSEGPRSPGELAARTGISTGGGITQLVDRLVKAGFVTRERSEQDRRRVLVTPVLEEVGRRIGPLYAGVGADWQSFLESLSTAELETCVRFLATAVEINRRHAAEVGDTEA
ncbi:MarR family winged helix-turn-helix transcriptional regulator [Nocardioides nitrophenolicus]|uniref:MarR family winged helix-turn-helix transcriptional regulator n=1 Tax=Nocardioides nitrophenolicus TaxID=60489 RepID=UPI0027DD15FA|nr:MarR family transcriptional regulator [Nocardioides nitrophenolicus]MBM7520039.1 DNA-binding MarR family transcriptional regulator [Nocardioides nitrophenolicus]